MNLHDFQKALFKLNTERFLKRWGSNWTLQFGARIWNCFVWRGWELQDWVSDPVHPNRRIDVSTYFWPYAACAVVCFSDVCSLKKQSSSFTSDTWERNLQLCFASLCEWRAFWVSRLQDDILHIYCTRANNPTKATFLLEQKISGGRVRAPWKRRCCGFFLNESINKSFYGLPSSAGRRPSRWRPDADVKEQSTLVWVGARCPSLPPEISSSPRVTTCYYYGLSDVSERRCAVKHDELEPEFILKDVKAAAALNVSANQPDDHESHQNLVQMLNCSSREKSPGTSWITWITFKMQCSSVTSHNMEDLKV